MAEDRGRERAIQQHEPNLVASFVRALYESRQPLQKNDFLYANEWSAGELVTVPKDSGEEDVLIRNPADSGVYLNFDPTYIVGGARLQVSKIKNVAVDTLGPELDVINQRTDVSNDTTIQVNRDNTWTEDADTQRYPARLVGAQKSDTFQVDAEELLIAPGDNAVVEVVNPSSADAQATVYLDIIEIPANVVDTIGGVNL